MKSGIDWFPLDVSLDEKFELMEAEFGLDGFAVVVKLFQRIFGGEGYYCEWTNEVALLFAKRVGMGGNAVSEILSAAIKRGIFDSRLFEKYRIITSRGIQKRYFEAIKRRNEFTVIKQYLLVDPAQICKKVNITYENVNIHSENADNQTQSRVEKSREEKSREEEGSAAPGAGGGNPSGEQPNPYRMSENMTRALSYYMDKVQPIPNGMVIEEMKDYAEEIEADAIIRAIDIATADKKPYWSYIKGVLKGYKADGVKTLADVMERESRHQENKERGNGRAGTGSGKSSGSDKKTWDVPGVTKL